MRRLRPLAFLAGWLVSVVLVACVTYLAIGLAGEQIGVVPGPMASAPTAVTDAVTRVSVGAADGDRGDGTVVGEVGGAGAEADATSGAASGTSPIAGSGVSSGAGVSSAAGATSGAGPSRDGGAASAAGPVPPARTGHDVPGEQSRPRIGAPVATTHRSSTGSSAAAADGTRRAGAGRTAAGQPRTGAFSDPAGQITLSCTPTRMTRWSVLAARGWAARVQVSGPTEVRVRFTRAASLVSVTARCEGGRPWFVRGGAGARPGSPSGTTSASRTTPASRTTTRASTSTSTPATSSPAAPAPAVKPSRTSPSRSSAAPPRSSAPATREWLNPTRG